MNEIWKESFADARYLAKEGYDVIRNKIEATGIQIL